MTVELSNEKREIQPGKLGLMIKRQSENCKYRRCVLQKLVLFTIVRGRALFLHSTGRVPLLESAPHVSEDAA